MRYHLKSLSLATATLLLSLTSPHLPFTLKFEPLVVQAQTTQDKKAEATRLRQEGFQLLNRDQFREALEKFQQALVIFRESSDREGEGDTLNNIGDVYIYQNQPSQAFKVLQQALIINRKAGNRKGEGTSLNNLGGVYESWGGYTKALEFYQQALAISKEVRDREGEGTTLTNMGGVYHLLGQYLKAVELLHQAVAICKEVDNRSTEVVALNNLAGIYESLGQYPKALEIYQQAQAIEGKGSSAKAAFYFYAIGRIYAGLGQYPKAIESYQQAVIIQRELGNRQMEGLALSEIGRVYANIRQYPKALEFYQQALVISKEVGNRYVESGNLSSIGQVYSHLQQYPVALKLLQQALIIERELGNKPDEAYTLASIGYLLEQQNQTELAIVFYKQSVNVTEAIRQDLQGLPKEQQQSYTETVAGTYRRLADLLLKQDRVLEAQRVLDLLKVQELEDYLRNVRGNNNTTQGLPNLPPEAQFNQGYEALVNKAITLGKELTQLEKISEQNRTTAQQQRVIELRNTQQKILAEYDSFIHSPTVETIVQQLTQTAKRQNLDLEDLNSLQSNLKKLNQNAVLLYPLILNDRLELVLVTADSPPIHRAVSVKREDLNRVIAQFRTALENPSSDAKTPAHQLYDWLIKPIENDLTQANAQTIIYAPDAQLRYIPLAALHDGKQWLVQRFRVNNITARSLKDINTQPQVKPHVLAGAFTKGSYRFKLGNQEFSFNGLPFAAREVETLAATVPGTTQLLDQAFSRDGTVLRMNDYNIIHLATHAAFVTGQPEDSFVLFGDGHPATLEDIKKWSLPNVDLVVLSACETGLGGFGNGQEILGFGYLMEKAGARSAIASLWSVDDGGTQALMNAFYTALKNGMSKAEALRQAQTALITKDLSTVGGSRGEDAWIEVVSTRTGLPKQVSNNLNHPHYWAPFILIGNGL